MAAIDLAASLQTVVGQGMIVCSVCGDRIGVYEPLLELNAGRVRRTSVAREPALEDHAAVLLHAECYSVPDDRQPVIAEQAVQP